MFAIIDNPASGKGQNIPLVKRVEEMLKARGEMCRIFVTECEGDGARQARLALEAGCTSIVVIGGDGTLSEVVGELAGKDAVLYMVPRGTGNDFARAFGLIGDPLDVFAAQLDGQKKQIDLGKLNGKAFLNVSGSGFDVEVLRKTEELKMIYPGAKAYRKAVLSTISRYQAFEAELSIDGGAETHERVTIIEIANGRYIGGGMHVAPGAAYDDGLFDVVVVDRVWSWAIPFLLPLFILGVHPYLPIARVQRAKRVRMRAKDMVVNVDGRLEKMDVAEYEVMPGALWVMQPEKK